MSALLSQASEEAVETETEKCPRCETPYEDYRGYRMLCTQCNPEQYRSAHKAAIDASSSRRPQSVSEE